jgi:hypothetical protein
MVARVDKGKRKNVKEIIERKKEGRSGEHA